MIDLESLRRYFEQVTYQDAFKQDICEIIRYLSTNPPVIALLRDYPQMDAVLSFWRRELQTIYDGLQNQLHDREAELRSEYRKKFPKLLTESGLNDISRVDACCKDLRVQLVSWGDVLGRVDAVRTIVTSTDLLIQVSVWERGMEATR